MRMANDMLAKTGMVSRFLPVALLQQGQGRTKNCKDALPASSISGEEVGQWRPMAQTQATKLHVLSEVAEEGTGSLGSGPSYRQREGTPRRSRVLGVACQLIRGFHGFSIPTSDQDLQHMRTGRKIRTRTAQKLRKLCARSGACRTPLTSRTYSMALPDL